MHTFSAKLGIIILGMSLSIGCFANPCIGIATACEQLGYYKGGHDKNAKGLIEDCVLPIVNGNMTLPNTNFNAATLTECKALVMEKMMQNQAN